MWFAGTQSNDLRLDGARFGKRLRKFFGADVGERSSAVRPIGDLAVYWPHERAVGPVTGCVE